MSFTFRRNQNGSNITPQRGRFPVGASQDLKLGDLVVWHNNRVQKAGTPLGRVMGVMADASDSVSAGTLVDVDIVTPSQVWRGTASAAATSHVNNNTRSYDINAAQQVNLADTTGGSIQIVGIDEDTNTAIDVQFTECYWA